MYSIFEEENEDAATHHNRQRGMVTFREIYWQKFKQFNKKISLSEYTGLSNQMLRSLEPERLSQYQTEYYNNKINKEAKESLFDVGSSNSDNSITSESRKRGSDNKLEHILTKCSRPSSNKQVKKLHGTPYFKVKGYFEEENLNIGERNNCKKVNIPCLTVFGINNCRQTQKDLDDEKIISYVDAKILAQVNRIKDPTPQEIKEARDYNSDSDFVMCTFPKYDKKGKLLGITEEVCVITILGDPQDNFYDNGFLNENKTLWSGFKRNKLPNPVSFTMPSFIKRPMKEGYYDPSKRCEIFRYTPQLCDRNEEANKQNNMPYIPFIEVNKNTFGENFHPPDLIGTDVDKKNVARKAVRTVAKIMAKENAKRIISNMEHVIKKFDDADEREFFVLGKKHNDFSNSRLILN